MGSSRTALDFVDNLKHLRTPEDIGRLVSSTVGALGFDHYSCAQHIDFANPQPASIVLVDYPLEWANHYLSQGYHWHDIIQATARRSVQPFRWDEMFATKPVTRMQRQIYLEAGEAGMRNGYSVPIMAPRSPVASFNVATGDDRLDPRALPAIHLIAAYLYETLRRTWQRGVVAPVVELAPRERECLTWAAEGKSSGVIAELTGLSRETVEEYVDRAKRRYGVATRVQAITRALMDGQISPQG